MADNNNTSVEAAAYTAQGTPRDRVALPAETFDGTVNMPVMHQAVKAFLANQRQGNAMTKIRKFVTGGNQKPWKQKGRGRSALRTGWVAAPCSVRSPAAMRSTCPVRCARWRARARSTPGRERELSR